MQSIGLGFRALVIVIFLLQPHSAVYGVIRITGAGGGSSPSGVLPSGSNLTIVVANNVTLVRIYTDDPQSEDIGLITVVNGGGAQQAKIVISSDTSIQPPTTNAIAPGCRHLGGFDASARANISLNASISGDLTGLVIASKINRMDVAGTIYGVSVTAGISATDTTNESVGLWLEAGAINGNALLQSLPSSITRIATNAGSMNA